MQPGDRVYFPDRERGFVPEGRYGTLLEPEGACWRIALEPGRGRPAETGTWHRTCFVPAQERERWA